MKLKIISPDLEKTVDIAWIELNTQAGNFVILPKHAPMITALSPDKELTFCLTNGKQETIIQTGGTVSISRQDVTLLLFSTP